jgi:hypothetical protein
MTTPEATWLAWAQSALGGTGPVEVLRPLREGGAPWLLRVMTATGNRDAVLAPGDADGVRTEVAGLVHAHLHGIPAPEVYATDLDLDPPLMLLEALAGSSAIPIQRPTARLRELGRTAARISAVVAPDDPTLPLRTRSIPGIDFGQLREKQSTPLLARAEAVAANPPETSTIGFVHGDLWQGNVLWEGDQLVAVVDWDCAGFGPTGIDLGSLRCDAAMCFGVDAAEDVLDGWQEQAGRDADDVAFWDVVASLCTPPDISWFTNTIADQGRADLTQEVLLQRRDAFLDRALVTHQKR